MLKLKLKTKCFLSESFLSFRKKMVKDGLDNKNFEHKRKIDIEKNILQVKVGQKVASKNFQLLSS